MADIQRESICLTKIVFSQPQFVNPPKDFHESLFLCKSICGLLLKPTSLDENNEISSICERNGISGHSIPIRITDKDLTEKVSGRQISKEGIWRDILNNERISFTNWNKGQPSGRSSSYDYAYMNYGTGKWKDYDGSYEWPYFVCELP